MATRLARKASLSFSATFTPLDVDCCRRNLVAFDGASPKPAKSRAIADALLFGIAAYLQTKILNICTYLSIFDIMSWKRFSHCSGSIGVTPLSPEAVKRNGFGPIVLIAPASGVPSSSLLGTLHPERDREDIAWFHTLHEGLIERPHEGKRVRR